MLNSPRSKKVLDAIFEAALDDNHKHQSAAWKLIVDRIVPVSGFEKEAGALRQSAITVNITGVDGVQIGSSSSEAALAEEQGATEALEAEYEVTDE